MWLFFDEAIPATLARRLGSHILTETMEGRPDVGLDSYDRLFPNQDTMPQGGFGNLIALPLQKKPREQGNSVFLDANDAWRGPRLELVLGNQIHIAKEGLYPGLETGCFAWLHFKSRVPQDAGDALVNVQTSRVIACADELRTGGASGQGAIRRRAVGDRRP